MDRRKFLVGLGSASIGGSALVGSGAFTRVESQRNVTIAVAEDPDAYLGLDKCGGENPTPNGSYAHLDDHGHLEILMNPENPTRRAQGGDTDLGAGVNSNSRTYVDNVFQICNQGKERACVWIGTEEGWPTKDGEPRVQFYTGGSAGASDLNDLRAQSIVGERNAIGLDVGDCICVGIAVMTKGLSEGDTLLDAIGDDIVINADVDSICGDVPPEEQEYPYFQADLVVGEPLTMVYGDGGYTYSSEGRLVSVLHGAWDGSIIQAEADHGPYDDYEDCIDPIDIWFDADAEEAYVEFEVPAECDEGIELSFTSYGSNTEGWDPGEQQFLFDSEPDILASNSGVFYPGTHTFTVSLPSLVPP